MVVAVAIVRPVKMAVDEVVDVIAVRHGLVPAVRSVNVTALVAAAVVLRRAAVRMLSIDGDRMLVDVVAVRVVEMSVVQVVDMPLVIDGGVAASWAVVVIVLVVHQVIAHADDSRPSPAARPNW
jgi:hypothetical protein